MAKPGSTVENATETIPTSMEGPSNTANTVSAELASPYTDEDAINTSLYSIFFREAAPQRAYAIYAMAQNSRDFPIRLPLYDEDSDKPGMPSHITLTEARRPQLYYVNQPYLGFVPLDNVFEGPIFGRFHGSRPFLTQHVSQLPCGLYIFDQDLAESWIRVEYALILIARHFYNPLRPLTAPTPPYPSNTKFYEAKPTVKRVVDSVVFAQKLFVFLIAELRHNIAMNRRVDSFTTWVQHIETSPTGQNIDKGWLEDLSASKAMNTTRLVGYFIDPTKMLDPMLNQIRIYYNNNAPIYLIFARIDRSNPFKSKFLYTLNQTRLEKLGVFLITFSEALSYIENVEIYMQRIYVAREICLSPRQPEHYLPSAKSPHVSPPYYPPHLNNDLESPVSPIVATEEDNLPEPLPGSGQKIGEWWYEFLLEQRRYYSQEILLETSLEHEERIKKEDDGLYYNSCVELPQDFDAIVYAWKPTFHPEFLLRTPLEMCEVVAYWPSYPPNHRIYDIFNNVWDLYDPSCDMVALTWSSEPTQLHIDDVEPSACDAGVENPTQEAVNNLYTSIPDLLDDRRKYAKVAKARLKKERESLFYFANPVEYARHRYGFVPPPPSFHFNHEANINWWLYLGQNLQNETVSNTETLSLALGCLMHGHSEHIQALFDIYVHATELVSGTNVDIQRIPDALFKTVDGESTRNLYLLRFPHSRHNDWVVGLSNAANVVLALREGWTHHRSSLVQNFLKYGIEFSTLRPLNKDETNPASVVVKHRLPLTPESGRFLISDYQTYERERELLFDSPIGRIAGRSGGTVARLWRKNIRRFNERVRDVNRGPSDEGTRNGVKVYCGGSMAFYDDYLPTTIDALICGQYLARPGSSATGSLPKVAWYKPNYVLNQRREPYSSRWVEMDEYKFIETEEKILDGQPPQNIGKFKKESSDKIKALDAPYEKECIRFLDYYIRKKTDTCIK